MKTKKCDFTFWLLRLTLVSLTVLGSRAAFADPWMKDKSVNTSVPTPRAPTPRVKSTTPLRNAVSPAAPPSQSQAPNPSGAGALVRCAQEINCDEEHGWYFNESQCRCVQQTPSPTPSEAGGSCVSSYQQQLDECRTERAGAESSCDVDRDSGISQSRRGLENFTTGLGQQGSNLANACTGLGQALGAANGAVAAFTQACSSAKRSCVSKCSSLKRDLDRELNSTPSCVSDLSGVAENPLSQIYNSAVAELESCQELETKVQQGVAAVNNTMGTIQGAMNCGSNFDTTLTYCKQNPQAIGCSAVSTDCSNPTIASTSPICICAKNPNDPSCSVSMKGSTGAGGGRDMASSAPGLVGGSAGGGVDAGLDNVDWRGRDWKKSNDTGEDPGGSKGGRPIQDGGAGGSGGPEGAGGSGQQNAVNVNAGFRGGGGGGGGFAGGGGEGGVAHGEKGAGGRDPRNPDLRQFLPGGKFDPNARGIAGISGPDGITGPHSNIWQKIQNRYQEKRSTLIP